LVGYPNKQERQWKQVGVLGTLYFLEAKVLDGVTVTSAAGAHLAFI
jgi:hypothetical protein